MPGLKPRKPAKRSTAKPKVAKKAKVIAKSALRTRSTIRKPAPAKAKVAAKRKAPVKRIVVPPHPDQTSVYMAPHHVDHHSVPGGIHVHPQPTIHPTGKMGMKHVRPTIRHH